MWWIALMACVSAEDRDRFAESDVETCVRAKTWEARDDEWRLRMADKARLEAQGSKSWAVSLLPTTEYRVVTCGSAEVTDIGLELLDADGNVVASAGGSRDPSVGFRPPKTGAYTVVARVRALAEGEDHGFVAAAVMHR
jgi:hypothetical protein